MRSDRYEDGDGIHLSSERRLTKSLGELFEVVIKEECCASNPNLIIHIGDDEDSDFRAPRRKGIRAFLFSQVLLEAKVLGDFPFSSDQAGIYYTRFAPRLSVTDAVRYLLWTWASEWARRSQLTRWVEASCKRGDGPGRLLLSRVSRAAPAVSFGKTTPTSQDLRLAHCA